jgi:acylphosphatase
VQGVYYRAFVRQCALDEALTGFARNQSDGSVKVLAEGPEDALHGLLARLREGPPASIVRSVDWSIEEGEREYDTFSVL